jgi:hypothetical protein
MSSGPARSPFRPHVFHVAGWVLAAALLPAAWAQMPAQPQPQPPGQPHATLPGAVRPVLPTSAAKLAAKQRTKPLWVELTPAQQQALVPLAPKWDTLSESQKRKWLALSQNFPKMSGAEQDKLHSRMTEWVALSPQQRTTARLNFGQTQQLSPDDKKAKWEAYQALPPEEKKKLAAKAAKPPATGAGVPTLGARPACRQLTDRPIDGIQSRKRSRAPSRSPIAATSRFASPSADPSHGVLDL